MTQFLKLQCFFQLPNCLHQQNWNWCLLCLHGFLSLFSTDTLTSKFIFTAVDKTAALLMATYYNKPILKLVKSCAISRGLGFRL